MDSAKILKFQLFSPKGMPIATATTVLSLKITQPTKSYLHFNFLIFRQSENEKKKFNRGYT